MQGVRKCTMFDNMETIETGHWVLTACTQGRSQAIERCSLNFTECGFCSCVTFNSCDPVDIWVIPTFLSWLRPCKHIINYNRNIRDTGCSVGAQLLLLLALIRYNGCCFTWHLDPCIERWWVDENFGAMMRSTQHMLHAVCYPSQLLTKQPCPREKIL